MTSTSSVSHDSADARHHADHLSPRSDINCGCPIDLVFNKGAGSALLQHAGKLGRSLVGMSQVLGEIPLTIKIRNGVSRLLPAAPQKLD